jgi:hypothetical protein
MNRIVSKYRKELQRMENTGITTETSYYYPLKTFLKEVAKKHSKKHKDIIVIPEAKAQWFGKPDFTILNANNKLIGVIEAKIPGTNLAKLERTSQIESYRGQIPNFIFTNFYDFRLYNHRNNKVRTTSIDNDNIINLLTTFLSKIIPENYSNFVLTKKQKEKQKKYGYVDITRNGKIATIILDRYVIMGKPLTKKEIQALNRNGWVDIIRNDNMYELSENGRMKMYD